MAERRPPAGLGSHPDATRLARAVESHGAETPGGIERREAVMKGMAARSYLDRFGTVTSVLELDALTWRDVAEALDTEREDPLLNPWRGRYGAAVRRALGH